VAPGQAALTADAAQDRAALRRRLRRSERLRQGQAALLVAPLFLFLLVFFLMPIAGMLVRSIDNPELRTVMPHTAALIRDWTGEGLPD
jgi:putative spermidine/putrescine transport system permease protein